MPHERYMRVALSLARRQLGRTWPNPAVGAILVKHGQIISQGVTADGGRPHAETTAIKEAGEQAKGSTLYVTLEPCSHHGKTPPCVDAVIESGITTVVVACRDKNPQVNGAGIAALKNAAIAVIENICEKDALEVNRGFFSIIEKKRPFIALKIATSLDGKIAFANNASSLNPQTQNLKPQALKHWLTGEHARFYAHLLRSRYDAILTGIGTVLEDDPLLTCRLPGLENHSPVRVVLDRNLRIPKEVEILTLQEFSPTWVMQDKTIDSALQKLTEKGITSVLVEAGAKLTTAFLESGLVDRIYWFRAPIIIGEGGLSATTSLNKLASFKLKEHITLGNDSLDIYENNQRPI